MAEAIYFTTTDGTMRIAAVGLPRTTPNHQILRGFVEEATEDAPYEIGTTVILRAAFELDEWTDQQRAQRRTLLQKSCDYAQLLHPETDPRILTIDTGDGESDIIFASRMINGSRLERHILATYPTGAPLEEGLQWIRQITASLRILHEHALIHRNINPNNILIDEQGNAKLIGYASIQPQRTKPSPLIAGVDSKFSAPEIVEDLGGKYISAAADVYSIGAVMSYVFSGEELTKMIEAPVHVHAWTTMAQHPDGLRLIIAKCMAPLHTERLPNAGEIDGWLTVDTLPTRETPEFEDVYLDAPWIGSGDESRIGALSPGPLVSRSPQTVVEEIRMKKAQEDQAAQTSESKDTAATGSPTKPMLPDDAPFFTRHNIPVLTIVFGTIAIAMIVLYSLRAFAS